MLLLARTSISLTFCIEKLYSAIFGVPQQLVDETYPTISAYVLNGSLQKVFDF